MSEITSPEFPRSSGDTADEVFKAWERLRIAYNVVLGLGMIPWIRQFLDRPDFTLQVGAAAVLANVCFCAGPVAEGYASLIGLPRRPSRWVIFAAGVLLSLGLEIVSVIAFLEPASN